MNTCVNTDLVTGFRGLYRVGFGCADGKVCLSRLLDNVYAKHDLYASLAYNGRMIESVTPNLSILMIDIALLNMSYATYCSLKRLSDTSIVLMNIKVERYCMSPASIIFEDNNIVICEVCTSYNHSLKKLR